MSSSKLSNSPAKMGKTNAKPALQNGGCRSGTVTRAIHANSANLAGGALKAKIIFDGSLSALECFGGHQRGAYWRNVQGRD